MKNLKKFILILIFLIDFSIACAVKFPRWILDVHSVYPEDVYIAMLGSGKSIEEAKNDSLSQLARYFDSQIVVNTNAKNKRRFNKWRTIRILNTNSTKVLRRC